MEHQARRYQPVRAALAVLAAMAVALVPGVAAPPAFAAATLEGRAVELINRDRVKAGLPPVEAAPALAAAAADAPYDGCGYRVAGRSADLGARGYFSHTILDCGGRTVVQMLGGEAAGYSAVTENIAWVSAVTDPLVAAERLHNDLMASPSHRANILAPGAAYVGVGSWHTAAGATWSGGGAPLRNVFLTTQIFTRTAPGAPSGGSRYHPLSPSRILDTRETGVAVGPGAAVDLQVAGAGGVPPAGVSAVVLNVTVTEPTAASFLTVFPAGEALPVASNLNFNPGQTVPNLVTAKLGAGGRLSLYNAAGTTHVVVDVAGWYDDGTLAAGATYHALTPARVLDTRVGPAPVGTGSAITLQVSGRGGVPAAGVSAVVLNVTVTEPTAASFLTVFPAGQGLPMASNVNFSAGQTVPNLVIAKLGAGGGVALYNAAGSTHVVADVAGWYDDGSSATGARFHPLSPSRILDTRTGPGPLGPQAALALPVAGRGGVPAAGASAVVLNVAVTQPTAASFLTVFPAGQALPLASNLNFVAGQTVPNLVAATLGAGGQVSVYNAAGSTHVVADVAGWFG